MEVDYVDPTSISVGGKIIQHDVWLSDNFKVLGLELKDDPDDDEIKSAYRKLAIKKHPDKHGGSLEEFQGLRAAYSNIYAEDKRGKKLTREMRTEAAERARQSAAAAAAPAPALYIDPDMFSDDDDEDTGGTTAEKAAAAAGKRNMKEARDKAAAVAEEAVKVAAVATAEAENAEEVARGARERATEAQAAAEKAKEQSDEINNLVSKQDSRNITSVEKIRLTEIISEIMGGAKGGGDKKRKSKRKKSKRKKSKRKKSKRRNSLKTRRR